MTKLMPVAAVMFAILGFLFLLTALRLHGQSRYFLIGGGVLGLVNGGFCIFAGRWMSRRIRQRWYDQTEQRVEVPHVIAEWQESPRMRWRAHGPAACFRRALIEFLVWIIVLSVLTSATVGLTWAAGGKGVKLAYLGPALALLAGLAGLLAVMSQALEFSEFRLYETHVQLQLRNSVITWNINRIRKFNLIPIDDALMRVELETHEPRHELVVLAMPAEYARALQALVEGVSRAQVG